MRFLFLLFAIVGLVAAAKDQQIKNSHSTIDFEGSSGGMKLYKTTGGDGFVQVKQDKIMIGAQAISIAPADWTDVSSWTETDGTKTWSTSYTIVDGVKTFKLTAWMYEVQRVITNGTFTFTVPANTCKFSIDTKGHTVPAGQSIVYSVTLSSKRGKDGHMGDKSSTCKRAALESGYVDFPTQAFIDGVLTDITVALDTTASDKTVATFTFPGPINDEVSYDPVISRAAMSAPQFFLLALVALLALATRHLF